MIENEEEKKKSNNQIIERVSAWNIDFSQDVSGREKK